MNGFARVLRALIYMPSVLDEANRTDGQLPRNSRGPGRIPVVARLRPTMLDNAEAQERGIRLLKGNLSPAQREQYEKNWHFDVIGGKSGKRYRIRHGSSMNIDQFDKIGRRVCGWCFYPRGDLVVGDVMLAQKLALELFEPEALKIANRVW